MRISNKKLSLFFTFFFLLFTFFGCGFENDVSFSRRVLAQLIEGRHSVRNSIDWPHLKMLLIDLGAQYSMFKSDEARVNYQRSFITNFSIGFKEKGAKLKNFFNWHLDKKQDAGKTVVAANCPDKNTTFYFTISRSKGQRKLSEILVLHNLQPGEKFPPMPAPQNPAPALESSIPEVKPQEPVLPQDDEQPADEQDAEQEE